MNTEWLCCDKMKAAMKEKQIEYLDDAWGVSGCCGGCWVLSDITHCPFCGTALLVDAPIIEGKVEPKMKELL